MVFLAFPYSRIYLELTGSHQVKRVLGVHEFRPACFVVGEDNDEEPLKNALAHAR